MNLRQLKYFTILAEELHFRGAAERLGIAQPALTRQLQELEKELDVQLVRRDRRNVELTLAGHTFLNAIRTILAGLDEAVAETRRVAMGKTGRLAVAFVTSASYTMVPTILKQFRRDWPDIDLELKELLTKYQLVELEHGAIDLGIVRLSRPITGFAYRCLLTEPFVLALPQNHPMAGKRGVPLTAFAKERFIMYPRLQRENSPLIHGLTMDFFRRAGFQPQLTNDATGQLYAVLGLVNAGLGVSLVPQSLMYLRTAGVGYAMLAGDPPVSEIGLVWRPDDDNPALAPFIQAAQAATRDLPEAAAVP